MKKEILNTIKESINDNTPNILNKIDLNAIIIDPVEEIVTKSKLNINLFKILIPLTTIVLVLSLALTLGLSFNKPNKPITYSVSNKDKLVANYATSAIDIINFDNTSRLSSFSNDNIIITNFHKYSNLLLEYLKLSNNEITISSNNDTNYNYLMNIKHTNFFNEVSNYKIYYNQEGKKEADEIEKNMEGIIVFNDLTLNFKAELEKETDEEELEIIIYDNNGNKTTIEKEVEDKDYEVSYKTTKDNKLINEISFEVQNNDVELEVKELRDNNYIKNEYELNYLSKNYYLVKTSSGVEFHLTLDLSLKQFIYQINNETIIKNN